MLKNLLLISSLMILSVGLFYDIAYADHPEPVELTFNQENYEFGDTMIITTTLPEPWNTIDMCKTKVAIYPGSYYEGFGAYSTTDIDEFGQSTFTIPLNTTEITAHSFSYYGKFTTHYEHELKPGYCININHETLKYFNSTLNSDHDSTLLQNMNHIKSLNTTDQEHYTMIDYSMSMITNNIGAITTVQNMMDDMIYEEQSPLTIHTDKNEYYNNDFVHISGNVSNRDSIHSQVKMLFYYEEGVIGPPFMKYATINGEKFSYILDVNEIQESYDGNITIIVTYDDIDIDDTAETSFNHFNIPNPLTEDLLDSIDDLYDIISDLQDRINDLEED